MLDARDTNSNWLYSLRHLSNPRMKTMRWRHKYQYLENYVDGKSTISRGAEGQKDEYDEVAPQISTLGELC